MEKKITYAQALTNAINVVADDETRERLEDLLAQLNKKADKKKSAVDNSGYFESVKSALADGEKTPTELVAVIGVANTQKVASVVKPLIANGTVIKEQKGKKVTYRLA